MELTRHQKAALERIRQFVEDGETQVFVLRGYAGTGKTTLAGEVIQWMAEHGRNCWDCVLLASTGRAARILSEKTGQRAYTLHAHIYRFDVVEEREIPLSGRLERRQPPRRKKKRGQGSGAGGEASRPGVGKQLTLHFELKPPPDLPEDKRILYIVDEASMLSHLPGPGDPVAHFGSGSVLQDFFDFVGYSNKVLFIGDPAQLPPVVERGAFSPALYPPFIEEHFNRKAAGFEMTHILRQVADSPILQLAGSLRKRLQERQWEDWERPLIELKGSGIYHPYTQHIMIERYLKTIRAGGFEDAIIITHSNKQAYYLNRQIRMALFGCAPFKPRVGEILLVAQNSYHVPLANGDQVIVREVAPITERRGIRFLEVKVEPLHARNLQFVVVGGAEEQAPPSEEEPDEPPVFKTQLLLDFLHSPDPNLQNDVARELLIDFDMRAREKGLKQNSPEYLEAMSQDQWLNALRAKFGYAVTCHKAQGGEWTHCFLNISETLEMLEPEQRFRWLYTAVTRARSRLDIKPIYRGNKPAHRKPRITIR